MSRSNQTWKLHLYLNNKRLVHSRIINASVRSARIIVSESKFTYNDTCNRQFTETWMSNMKGGYKSRLHVPVMHVSACLVITILPMRKSLIMGFLFLPIWVWGSAWRPEFCFYARLNDSQSRALPLHVHEVDWSCGLGPGYICGYCLVKKETTRECCCRTSIQYWML